MAPWHLWTRTVSQFTKVFPLFCTEIPPSCTSQVNRLICYRSSCTNQTLHRQMDSWTYLFHIFTVKVLLFKKNGKRGHSFFSSPRQWLMTFDFKEFLSQILSITILSYLNSEEQASISFFSVKGIDGLWIEPGTSHTPSQHSTTSLSRRPLDLLLRLLIVGLKFFV